MGVQTEHRFTAEEYLALERQAESRSQYLDGEVFAMSGASREHNLIVLAIATSLYPQLDPGQCEIYANDMRVHIPATGLYTYPDVVAVCGEPRFEDEDLDTLLNPALIVEVLSPTTEAFDRGQKFAHYRSLPSLTDYLLVAQDRIEVEHFARREQGRWLLTAASRREDTVELPTLGARLALAQIYERVQDLWS